MITPVAINTIGWRYYLVYTCISGVIVPLVFFFFPETNHRSLEELEMLFAETPSIPAIVRESLKKPSQGGLIPEHIQEKVGKDELEDLEYEHEEKADV